MSLRFGNYERDHKDVLKLARLSPFTKGFADVRFVQEYYNKGWILVYEVAGVIIGFVCLRHCSRQPWTTIYYMGIHPNHKGLGLGWQLTQEVMRRSPWDQILLGVDGTNEDGQKSWERMGFRRTGQVTYSKQGGEIHQYRLERAACGNI